MVNTITELPFPGRKLTSTAAEASLCAGAPVFPSFVAGPENQLVSHTFERLLARHTASARSSVAAGHLPPSLVIYGTAGIGKTHLAKGLSDHWQREHGPNSSAYFTAGDYRRSFSHALATHRVDAFLRQTRSMQLLVIDDLHQLPKNAPFQEHLRNTFDAFEESGSTLVVTCDRPPALLPQLADDVVSRFASGLVLQLASPGEETRRRIISLASTTLGQQIQPQFAEQLAQPSRGTVHELVAALANLGSHLSVTTNSRPQIRIREIIAVVAKYCRVPQKLVRSGTRKQSIVQVRAIVIYLARELAGMSYEQIGRALGGRDHTTIMHSYEKIKSTQQRDPHLQQTLADLRRLLGAA